MTVSRIRLVGALSVAVALCAVVVAIVSAAQAGTPRLALKSEQVKSVGATVLADRNGMTAYRLKPETPSHLLCSSHTCLAVWPPVTVASKSTHVTLPRGARGKIGFLRRGKRFQLTFRGVPLYRYSGDSRARQAAGQHIHSFGGVWSVLTLAKKSGTSPPPPAPRPQY